MANFQTVLSKCIHAPCLCCRLGMTLSDSLLASLPASDSGATAWRWVERVRTRKPPRGPFGARQVSHVVITLLGPRCWTSRSSQSAASTPCLKVTTERGKGNVRRMMTRSSAGRRSHVGKKSHPSYLRYKYGDLGPHSASAASKRNNRDAEVIYMSSIDSSRKGGGEMKHQAHKRKLASALRTAEFIQVTHQIAIKHFVLLRTPPLGMW